MNASADDAVDEDELNPYASPTVQFHPNGG